MIDVSRLSGPCPRCAGRRVVGINQEANRWLCAPNPMPFPFRHQLREHEADNTEEFYTFEEKPMTEKTLHPSWVRNGR